MLGPKKNVGTRFVAGPANGTAGIGRLGFAMVRDRILGEAQTRIGHDQACAEFVISSPAWDGRIESAEARE